MKRMGLMAAVVLSLLLAGCSGRAPRVVTPETRHDFGDVPVTMDMREARLKEFVIMNEGTADLKIKDVQVKILEGC
ncbi:MAG: hypothetical protein ACOY93_10750 [Bacillota bacterium]